MNRGINRATRESFGCFVILVSATLTGVGILAILMKVVTPRHGDAPVTWFFYVTVVGSALMTALASWVVYGMGILSYAEGAGELDTVQMVADDGLRGGGFGG